MTMITNIRHFLDENNEVPDLSIEALGLLSYLAAIIEAATLAYDCPITFANVPCRSVVDDKRCAGEIEVWVYAENNEIGWECLECGEDGIITEWEGTRWDKRNLTRH